MNSPFSALEVPMGAVGDGLQQATPSTSTAGSLPPGNDAVTHARATAGLDAGHESSDGRASLEGMEIGEFQYAGDPASRLASAIYASLQFAGQFTDLMLGEGKKIMLKSAGGIQRLDQTRIPGTDLVVELQDLKNFFCHYMDARGPDVDAEAYWIEHVAPLFRLKKTVDRTATSPSGQYLRCSLFQADRGLVSMVIRVTTAPPRLESLGLPQSLMNRLQMNPTGLIAIIGPTASGKTSTAYSILDFLNEHTASHIVTVEDPIEYPMVSKQSMFTQREVGTDVESFAAGLRDALRQAPDAILVGEVRDQDTAETTILGSESGALMLVTTHGRSISGALRKVLALTGAQPAAWRSVLAGSLLAVIHQSLAPHNDGQGYTMVCDVLMPDESVRKIIEAGEWAQLDKLTSSKTATESFVPKVAAVNELVRTRRIDRLVGTALNAGY